MAIMLSADQVPVKSTHKDVVRLGAALWSGGEALQGIERGRRSSTGHIYSAFVAAAAVFQEKQLADLTIAIGQMNAYNRIAISFRVTPKALAG